MTSDQVPGVVPDDDVTVTPSLREGVTWDGEEFSPTQLAWESGAWVPSDETQGAVVDNSTSLERLRGVDRILVLVPVLALTLLICAWACALSGSLWKEPDVIAGFFEFAAKACLIGAAALTVVFVVLGVTRMSRTRRR